ncbi:hypothetical protein C8J57DRAFT_1254097 [Mycena rebaudengoi]|nr:hypothetical protein C8J57DRAFT_1254097 [Mycena rebaudengoi]
MYCHRLAYSAHRTQPKIYRPVCLSHAVGVASPVTGLPRHMGHFGVQNRPILRRSPYLAKQLVRLVQFWRRLGAPRTRCTSVVLTVACKKNLLFQVEHIAPAFDLGYIPLASEKYECTHRSRPQLLRKWNRYVRRHNTQINLPEILLDQWNMTNGSGPLGLNYGSHFVFTHLPSNSTILEMHSDPAAGPDSPHIQGLVEVNGNINPPPDGHFIAQVATLVTPTSSLQAI